MSLAKNQLWLGKQGIKQYRTTLPFSTSLTSSINQNLNEKSTIDAEMHALTVRAANHVKNCPDFMSNLEKRPLLPQSTPTIFHWRQTQYGQEHSPECSLNSSHARKKSTFHHQLY